MFVLLFLFVLGAVPNAYSRDLFSGSGAPSPGSESLVRQVRESDRSYDGLVEEIARELMEKQLDNIQSKLIESTLSGNMHSLNKREIDSLMSDTDMDLEEDDENSQIRVARSINLENEINPAEDDGKKIRTVRRTVATKSGEVKNPNGVVTPKKPKKSSFFKFNKKLTTKEKPLQKEKQKLRISKDKTDSQVKQNDNKKQKLTGAQKRNNLTKEKKPNNKGSEKEKSGSKPKLVKNSEPKTKEKVLQKEKPKDKKTS